MENTNNEQLQEQPVVEGEVTTSQETPSVELTAENSGTSLRRDVFLLDKSVGENIILYGVPGCGKSHTIENLDGFDKIRRERVVFHQDYTYSDFVGQILPQTDIGTGAISYPFIPGPFTSILEKAYRDKENMYFLVIEEINRGNAPAIFGEIFQLLDRNAAGESEYGITNFDIANHVYKDKNHEVKIPSNLTILATMNTADQNVFTLDTAFKRRWRMCSIKNDIGACKHGTRRICGTNVTWKEFVTKINKEIIENGGNNLGNEDKRLGAYFVKEGDLQWAQLFAEKVLMYLWNDAFKYNRDKVFKPEYKTLEDLIEGFYKKGWDVFDDKFGFDKIVIPYDTLGSAVSSSAKTAKGTTKEDLPEKEYLEDKAPRMVAIYEEIKNRIKSHVADLYTYTTSGKNYLVFSLNNLYALASVKEPKKSFAEFSLNKKKLKMDLQLYKPTDPTLHLGKDVPKTWSTNHKYQIEIDDTTDLDLVVKAILDSYEQYKITNGI